jgi:transient receptor potential cation channel subfamily C
MRSLVRRYITSEQRIQERQRGVTEDDCNEIKQDISALRFELLEMLGGRNKGFKQIISINLKQVLKYLNVIIIGKDGTQPVGKRGRQRERRLMKGFNFDFLLMDRVESFDDEFVYDTGGSPQSPPKLKSSSSRSRISRLARGLANKRRGGTRWRQLIEATRNKVMPFSRSQESMNSETIGSGSVSGEVGQPSLSMDANLKRSIFARKKDMSEPQPNIDNRSSPISDTTTERSTIIVKKNNPSEWI